ncbi:MAG: universal stress protein [Candidatus Sphingomonas colombiensis]|nr:universal stress protein [Sphingomonas sp.]WEK43206.1 MAG: universal stress protein [Sphingomonas sp.]
MKNLLLLVHDDEGQEARLSVAIDLAGALGGHLTCLDVAAPPNRLLRALDGAITTMVLEQERNAGLRRDKTALDVRLTASGVSFSWKDLTGSLDTLLIRESQLADLVILSTILPDDDTRGMVGMIRATTKHSRTPILAVPASATGFHANGRATVMWDGSPDAEAALCAAVPLLSLAGEIILLQVDDGSHGASLRDATDYLRRQGLVGHPLRHDPCGDTAAEVITRHIARHEPAFIVMGAFGHGRVHDALLGSVTRHLLAVSNVPLLIAHRA